MKQSTVLPVTCNQWSFWTTQFSLTSSWHLSTVSLHDSTSWVSCCYAPSGPSLSHSRCRSRKMDSAATIALRVYWFLLYWDWWLFRDSSCQDWCWLKQLWKYCCDNQRRRVFSVRGRKCLTLRKASFCSFL